MKKPDKLTAGDNLDPKKKKKLAFGGKKAAPFVKGGKGLKKKKKS